MFYATNRLHVPPDKAQDFEEQFTGNMRKYLPGVPGLRRSTLLRPAAAGEPYLSINEFDTEAHFRAWVDSDSFKQAHARNSGMVRNITSNQVETFESVEVL
ncbi:MAG: antibiotic biosynthesis monooxygenase [Saccharopolyspora sp.]|uniref:antibiotic biosynthesis monooxygenase family protein n=1 Tax=Saccharopolyspora TaxID=1835 RepID=UPI00190C427D|nr:MULTISPECIES: antibiotic biosynthesis monooxygenase [unclassified Saccharopolyspora]MBK0870165.1 antibiotic biosynthesis monooxygenase [Saccharopolyspora sp. HNM0986]MBQ6644021.1 antibiotic biosynthesis monooxygenase [Saccharopolyspora sp.]